MSTPQSPPLLELSGVHASYGNIEVLHGVDLALASGAVLALLGPNGAGKSTTLKVVSGQLQATKGCVHLGGRHVNGVPTHKLARIGLAMVPEGRGVFPRLSVSENLLMASYSGVDSSTIQERAFARFPRLGERHNQLAGTMSGGEQQMLALARGLATDPAVLVLDELSMGLAPLVVSELYELVAQVAASGVSILVVEQFARTVLGVADQAAIMANGKVTVVGTPSDIEAELSSAYLGASS